MPRTFHIRQPAILGQQNSQTLCGEEATQHDIRFSWQAFAAWDFEPCAKCVELRRKLKSKKPAQEPSP